ncbi:hypothetical protein JRO89_XS10G0193200 [Xanthoceras sorbifolium]|uniref:Fatty acyl-CoA reductase n=1 Tax=Xanthoceras sorbifolium TaxID=99658 RepID=A0ABQ8HJG9_9ROSI|nr:hypothetical protein JRO89_XS10G0193200 [Xanthoceras sorbifolium]
MESVNIIQFLEDKTILVIGATGFLGKIFVEKILRIQPNVKKLYLLVRARDAYSATQRILNEVVEKELFRVLRERWGGNLHSFISEKVAAVPGDICCENLGVKDSNLREEMWRETDIVLNFAATTNFDERYDVALDTNTMAPFHVLNFAKRCVKINMFLHVSTAYVCGETSGLITEKSFYLGETLSGETCKLNITSEKKLAEQTLNQLQAEDATKEAVTLAMKDLGIKRARLYGWPNTYVFTKAMGEMLLGYYKHNLPLVIIRPTIITSTCKEPFPGWIESLRTIDSIICGYGKGKVTCLPSCPDTILDLIPADMVVNVVILGMVANANNYSSHPKIYHVGSSMRNPIKISHLHEFMFSYFTKHPYMDRNGKEVQVSKGTVLETWDKFQRYIAIRYLLPLKGLELINLVFRQYFKDIYTDSDRKIKLVMRLAELYKPYMFFQGIFDNTNLKKLATTIKDDEVEVAAFDFDPKCIDWEDYIINTHIPGLVRYVIK